MEIHMREIFSMVKHMEKVFIIGLMVRSMTESGTRASSKSTVSGKELRTILILESGPPRRRMDMVCTTGQTETDTKDSGRTTRPMAKESSTMSTEISM